MKVSITIHMHNYFRQSLFTSSKFQITFLPLIFTLVSVNSTERPYGNSPVSSIIQTPVVQFENVNIVVISVSSLATGLLLLLCTVIFIVILLCATIRMKQRNKKGLLFLAFHCN